MDKKFKKEYKTNKGAAMMILVFFFVFISFAILVGITMPTIREFRISKSNFDSKQSYFLSESGVEDIIYRIKNNKQYNSIENLVLGLSSAITTITDISGSQKEISSLGDINSFQRKVSTVVNTGVGTSFNYGIFAGLGGFHMSNGSKIIGSVYSNGSITGSGLVTGSATAANTASLSSNQSNGSGNPDYDIKFGKYYWYEDFAQSFKIDTDGQINKIELYLKKKGKPSNLNVYIVNDSYGEPGSSILASGSLSSSLVSKNYGWVEVPFSNTSQFTAGTTYWFVIDGSYSSKKYYKIGANNNGYTNGQSEIGKYSSYWWWNYWYYNYPSSADAFFNIYVGGNAGTIDGISVGQDSVGDAYANTINNTTVAGTLYCQSGTGNNKNCNTSKSDPTQLPMPISDQNILDWKDQASTGGTYNGDYTVSNNTTLGPKKITGDLDIKGTKTLTITGTLWVTGKIKVENGGTVKLDPSYGSSSEVIVSDGKIEIENNANFLGSGSNGSYILTLTTSNSTDAISLENNSGAAALYAANGTINMSNNSTAKSIIGYYINLNNNAVINYEDGLANMNFIGGPSGSWNIKSWKEVK